MRKLFVFQLVMFACLNCFSQNNNFISLWPQKVPGEPKEKRDPVFVQSNDNVLRISEVTNPVMEIFMPEKVVADCPAVIVCPGGGYSILAYDLEGTEIASWLNKLGYVAFILQYRVPDKQEGALQDLQRAVRLVRKNAKTWNVDPEKVGVIGFSAGASLCTRASTLFGKKTYIPVDKADSLSCKPTFTMLIYPAYLDLGKDHTLTPELTLSKDLPPFFIFQTVDDPYGNSSLVMAKALRDAKLPVEFHFLPHGGHGYGVRKGNPAAKAWPILAETWLVENAPVLK